MGITKLLAFQGEAEILGVVRPVTFAGELLAIGGLALEDANAILNHLAKNELLAVKLPEERRPDAKAAKSNGAASKVQEAAPAVKEAAVAPVVPVPVQTAVAPPDEENDAAEPEPEPEPQQQSLIAPPTGDALPKEVVEAKYLKDVVAWLMDTKGLRTVADILAACVALKPRIKSVAVIPNLEDRVKRTVEILSTNA